MLRYNIYISLIIKAILGNFRLRMYTYYRKYGSNKINLISRTKVTKSLQIRKINIELFYTFSSRDMQFIIFGDFTTRDISKL